MIVLRYEYTSTNERLNTCEIVLSAQKIFIKVGKYLVKLEFMRKVNNEILYRQNFYRWFYK